MTCNIERVRVHHIQRPSLCMYLVLMQILKSFLGLVCPYLGPKIMQLDASQKNPQIVDIRPRLFENQP